MAILIRLNVNEYYDIASLPASSSHQIHPEELFRTRVLGFLYIASEARSETLCMN